MTTIVLLSETTEPVEFVHFHPAFPLLADRSSAVSDLPFEYMDRKFETILHCLYFARFASLDRAYSELFTLPQSEAFAAEFERIQIKLFGLVRALSGVEKVKFMGQSTSFFTFLNAIATSDAIKHVADSELTFFRTEGQQVMRKALFARYGKFAGTLPEPVIFESKEFPRIAAILCEVLVPQAVPQHVTSAPEASAYKLHALLSRKPKAPQAESAAREVQPAPKTRFQQLAENDPWSLMWDLSQRGRTKERVQRLFLFAFPKFKASPFLEVFGPPWMHAKKQPAALRT